MTTGWPWTCRDGDWLGVLGAGLAVLLPPEERDRAVALWTLVDDGAGFDDVLDALLRHGLRDLSELVLVAREGGAGGTTRVLVRGSAAVRLDGPEGGTTVAGDPARTWVEESRDGVTSVSVSLPAPATPRSDGQPGSRAAGSEAGELVVGRGLVRVGGVALAPNPPDPAAAPVSPLPGPPEPPEPPEQPEPPESPEQPEREDTRPQADADAGAADTGALPGPPTEAWSLPVPGGPAVGRDRPSVGQGGAAVGHPVARLLFSSGDVVDVDRVVLVGRAPDAGRARSGDGPHAEPLLVTVPSPQQGISSTHLEVRPGAGPDLGLAVVTDLGSTNGTLLIQPGVPPEDLKAGVGVPLVDGAVIDLGDGLTIRVLEP